MSSLSSVFLRPFVETYNIKVFVETGCFRGDGIAAALDSGISTVFSCDLDINMVEQVRGRFHGHPAVEIYHGDSLTFLKHVLANPVGPILFWLDAHYPAFFDMPTLEGPQTRFPVREELALISELRDDGATADVILIDDMRVIRSVDNPRWREGEVSDYFRIDDLTIEELATPLKGSHDAIVSLDQEGIMIMTPKKLVMVDRS